MLSQREFSHQSRSHKPPSSSTPRDTSYFTKEKMQSSLHIKVNFPPAGQIHYHKARRGDRICVSAVDFSPSGQGVGWDSCGRRSLLLLQGRSEAWISHKNGRKKDIFSQREADRKKNDYVYLLFHASLFTSLHNEEHGQVDIYYERYKIKTG